MKILAPIALCVMFFLPLYVFAQDQASPNQPETPKLKTQVIMNKGATNTPLSADTAPENVITTSSRPLPGPVMRSTSLPKSTLEEQILKYERQLAELSGEYRQANPEVVKNLELIIQRKKSEKLLREKAIQTAPSN